MWKISFLSKLIGQAFQLKPRHVYKWWNLVVWYPWCKIHYQLSIIETKSMWFRIDILIFQHVNLQKPLSITIWKVKQSFPAYVNLSRPYFCQWVLTCNNTDKNFYLCGDCIMVEMRSSKKLFSIDYSIILGICRM